MTIYCLLIAVSNAEDHPEMMWIIKPLVFIAMLVFFVRYLEPIYAHRYMKPYYVHLYLFPKRLSDEQQYILQTKFRFYQQLPPKQQGYFEHRVCRFIEKYPFIGKEGQPVTDEVKVLIAATSVMLTFGMRNYLYTVFDKIIVYPTAYYAVSSASYHKGEFNPALKALVFSWEDFVAGYRDSHDNRNLGLHEFAHALHFQSVKSRDLSSVIFTEMLRRIMKEVSRPHNKEKMITTGYFREYAYENQYEFLAVLLEHFFETPETFRQHFPELYDHVRKMINYRDYSGIS